MEKNQLNSVLGKLCSKDEMGYYIKGDCNIVIENGFIVCHKGLDVIFQIKDDVQLGTLLVILQEYQIFHQRYCYERLEAIEEDYNDNNDDDDDFEW